MPQSTLINPFAMPGRNKNDPKAPVQMVTDGPAPGVPGIGPARPICTAAPSLSGSTVVGSTLVCSHGSWSGDQLETSLTFAFTRNGRVVAPDSNAPGYVLTDADVGAMIGCRVLATVHKGGSGAAFTAAVGPVTATREVATTPEGGAAAHSAPLAAVDVIAATPAAPVVENLPTAAPAPAHVEAKGKPRRRSK